MNEVKFGVIGNVDSGKCHSADTPIMMHDGIIKLVQHIKTGDYLMGDDSKPRKVLSTTKGYGQLYEVKQVNGDSYKVNENHILSLKFSNWERIGYIKYKDIIDIEVKNYLKLGLQIRKCLKGYRVPLDFEEKDIPIDPYIYGYWLGDETSAKAEITTADSERIGCIFKKRGSNYFLKFLKDFNLLNNKNIIEIYKFNSREKRLQLLAGLIDSGGYYTKNGYEMAFKNEKLVDDVIYLSRSLGFATYTNALRCPKKCESFRFTIYSGNSHEIPCIIKRNIPKPCQSPKDVSDMLFTSIEVNKVEEGDYYGFELDGNHRFLLADFTVTHNSTMIGVLSYDILDDGRGFARNKILKLPHERSSGRTSSISNHYVRIPDKPEFISLLDLAGHEKYLRTTLHGLSGYALDYAIIVVGANMGVSRMTKEHLSIILPLRLPFIVVVSKIDIAPPDILKKTIEDIEHIIRKKRSPQKNTILINNIADVTDALEHFQQKDFKYCPIFQISNTQGENLDLLKNFVFNLNSRHDNTIPELPENQDKIVFKIYERFNVKGVGLVISGCLKFGQVQVGTKLFIGPIQGDWKEIVVKSLHDNFRNNINQLNTGSSGCMAVKFTDKKYKIPKKKIKKGAVITNQRKLYQKFLADIYILSSNFTTMKINYQPVLNCNTIVQGARIYDLEKTCVRGGEKVWVKFEFMYRPEYIEVGDLFLFREGNLKGFGKIMELIE